METFVYIYAFWGIYTTLITVQCFTDNSVCPNRKSKISNGKIVYYKEAACCDNYEMRFNKCVECNLGYFRPFDLSPQRCIPCEEGKYGKKCVFKCNCNSNERCNSIIGCVNVESKTFSYLRTVTNEQRLDNINTTAATEKDFTGFARQRIVYVVISGIMFVLFITCISFWYSFTRERKRTTMNGSVPITIQNSSNFATVQREEVVELNIFDHDYEEIDETNMVNGSLNIDNTLHESETDSNSGSSISPTEDDEGYLHPYHSLLHLKMIDNFVLDEHHIETDLRSNDLLQNPYDHLQVPIKIPTTTSGFEFMKMKEMSPTCTNSNKSGKEHVLESYC